MGYESIAHEVEGRMGYWLRGYEGERNNCFSKLQLAGQKKIWLLQKFGFIKRVDRGWITTVKDLESWRLKR